MEFYHPNAYLQRIKNFKAGLKARTAVLTILENESSNAKQLSDKASLSYCVVIHHLHLLEAEGSVARKGNRPYSWSLTGRGQKRLLA